MTEQLRRRDRIRASTVEEIKSTARRLLVEDGTDGVSLRAIARAMGLTAPALYRYFPSREALLEQLIADVYDEVTGAMVTARDEFAADDIAGRLLAVCRTFRRWALDHTPELGLLFGSPIQGVANPKDPDCVEGPMHGAGQRFGQVFVELVAALYLAGPFPVVADEEVDDLLAPQLREYCRTLPVELPLGLLLIFMSCWIRLYGAVCMEAFGHLAFAVGDAEPLFETELRAMATQLGGANVYRRPDGPRRATAADPGSQPAIAAGRATPAGRGTPAGSASRPATAAGR